MKKATILLITAIALVTSFFFLSENENPTTPHSPAPTEIASQEDEDSANKREKWFELMHQTDSNTNWQAIEYATQMKRHQKRAALREGVQNRTGLTEIAGGKLVGEWRERGSNNLAGSVFEQEFDPETEEVWLLSAGGTLYKGTLAGSDWSIINQDLRFNNGLLKFIPIDTGRRLLALINKTPHYSDDDGKTWTSSTGITTGNSWMTTRNCFVLNDSLNSIYVISKPDYWTRADLYKSVDKGETFQRVLRLGTHDFNEFRLCNPHNSNDLYLFEKTGDSSRVVQIDTQTDQSNTISTSDDVNMEDINIFLSGIKMDSVTKFVTYGRVNGEDIYAYQSTDFGESWEQLGQLESRPWQVGIFISPSDPNFMMAGEVHCQLSYDGGMTWIRKNDWWAYNDDRNRFLHADMMVFNEFETADGRPFQLVSNHGGLNISYDHLRNIDNLGLTGLTVSQYYSVRTDPRDPYFIYAGSQDQGFQIGNSITQENLVDFDKAITGDYGHIVFTQNGTKMWTVYPGGWVTNFTNPTAGAPRQSWQLDSEDESVWIPPIMPSPIANENAVYLAGGNANGGPGSHLIKLNNFFGDIRAEQLPFDFKDNSDGEVSAMTFSLAATENWFAATTNGRFFYSNDSGQNWEQAINFIPEGHYLYGQAIQASSKDSNLVFLGGSGYNNPACYVSRDGGQNFEAMVDSLPSTLIFDLAMNDEETMLFAATEAGPYVYLFDESRWYDMSGLDAPAQTYWSVEYVSELQKVRFGTYGRGIWDFDVMDLTDSKEIAFAEMRLKVFPNPTADGQVTIEVSEAIRRKADKSNPLKITSMEGQVVKTIAINPSQISTQADLSQLTNGIYLITWSDGKETLSEKLIIAD